MSPQPSSYDGSCSSQKETCYQGLHPGGCTPGSTGLLFKRSCYKHRYQNTIDGNAILSVKQLFAPELGTMFRYDNLYDSELLPEERTYLEEASLDRSELTALEEAIQGPAFAINCSFLPITLLDPRHDHRIPEEVLASLAALMEKHDKIVIWSANNNGICLEKEPKQFYKQILEHDILSKRMVFAVNVCPTHEADPRTVGTLTIKRTDIPFKLYYSSNYPGKSFAKICLSAMGSSVISGWTRVPFIRQSGTSEAAPVIASLATLVKQKFPEMSGIEVIQRLKDTALPLGDPAITGCGYVWAPGALGIK